MSHTNHLYDEIEVGQEGSITRVLTTNDLIIFAHASGNLNPIHLPELDGDGDGDGDGKPEVVAPSMWVGSLLSAVLGNILPGIGSLYQGQTLRFHGRVQIGDAIKVTVRVREKRPERVIVFDCRCELEDGTLIADGEAQVIAPERKVVLPDLHLPELIINRGESDFHEYDNPARNPDFFDQLRLLQQAISEIKEELRKINDADKLTASIRAAQAYLLSFEAFLDDSTGAAPDKVPEPVTRGLRYRLKSINWASVSSHAQKWVDTLVKLIDKMF